MRESIETTARDELRAAELRAERLSAAIRGIVFVALLAVFASIRAEHHQTIYAACSLTAYGLVVRRQNIWDDMRPLLTEASAHQVCQLRRSLADAASGGVRWSCA
jgi:hypothetical protein